MTDVLQHEEKDSNPNSVTYANTRWVDGTISSTCVITPDWQNTTVRCKVVDGQNNGQQEQEKRDMNPCSPTYNQPEWVVMETNCIACPTPAAWQANGSYRCAKDTNNNNTGRRERQEYDQSRCSPTWMQFRWVDDALDCVTCPRPENWQPTGNVRCQKNQYNSNTTFQEMQQQNMAACTPTYRWVPGQVNATACPTCYKCLGEGKLCLNDVCVFGVKVYTGAMQDANTLQWTCIYHYEWDSGAIWSQNYTEQSDRECIIN
jgi:hypothetical protein